MANDGHEPNPVHTCFSLAWLVRTVLYFLMIEKKNQKMSNISGNKHYTEFGVFYFQDEGVDELLGIPSTKYI